MATYLPIRALNRSAAVRIDGQKISATTTAYVDLSKASVRKEFAYHSAISQVYPVGQLSASNSDVVVAYGAVVDQGASGADLILGVSIGELRVRSTGAYVPIAATVTAATLSAADATNPRIDLVVADTTSGAVSKVDGTAAASPVAPAVPAGKIALAQVAVAANATGITNANITDIRPRS